MMAKELARDDLALPNFVSVNPVVDFNAEAYVSGFLGPRYAPLDVKPSGQLRPAFAAGPADDGLHGARRRPSQAAPSVSPRSASARRELLESLQSRMLESDRGGPAQSHHATLERAIRLMSSDAGAVFDLTQESPETRQKYGRGTFGQGCLLARRLIEQGVPFVEVSLGDFGAAGTRITTTSTRCSSFRPSWTPAGAR